MAFNERGKGFITSTYHGNDNAYLYCSSDGGQAWHTSVINVPENVSYSYINSYSPYFIGKYFFMILEYVNQVDDYPEYIMYYSADNGETWEPRGSIKLQSTSIVNDSFSDKNTVYIIDDKGMMFDKVYDNKVWN
jgi:hypothetical protein